MHKFNKVINVALIFALIFFGIPEIGAKLDIDGNYVVLAATQTFTTSGSWQAPNGVTSVIVEAWGGGGAGGGRGSSSGASGGGGGGAYARATLTVVPTQSYDYIVGAGVAGGAGNGSDGNPSYWDDGSEVFAAAGKGGAQTTTGGAGGLADNSVGTTKYNGGNGADAAGTSSGGGGGGAGSTGPGGAGNAFGGSGTSEGGGNGGAAVTNANGNPGSTAGGGGSGARRTNGNRSGGAGAAGQIRITYNTPPYFFSFPTDTPDPVDINNNVTFAAEGADSDGDNWYLVVCKTNSVTPGTPPSCASSQTFCVSSSAVASLSENSCIWTADSAGTHDWYAFACDNSSLSPACSAANTNNSPITVNAAPVISITVTTDGAVAWGTMGFAETKTTMSISETQTLENDGNQSIDINIKTSNATGGNTWTVGGTPGSDVFVYEFSSNSGSNWTAFTAADSYQTFATNVAAAATRSLDLRLTTPSPATDLVQKTITVTVQAVEH